jgi:hypothetical protein
MTAQPAKIPRNPKTLAIHQSTELKTTKKALIIQNIRDSATPRLDQQTKTALTIQKARVIHRHLDRINHNNNVKSRQRLSTIQHLQSSNGRPIFRHLEYINHQNSSDYPNSQGFHGISIHTTKNNHG